jgi:hypothetical protein
VEDPRNGHAFVISPEDILEYDPLTGAVLHRARFGKKGIYVVATYDSKRNYIFYLGSTEEGLEFGYFDVSNSSRISRVELARSVRDPEGLFDNYLKAPGLEYDPVGDQLVIWYGLDGKNGLRNDAVWAYRVDHNVVRRVLPSSNNTVMPTKASFSQDGYTTGVYGHWGYFAPYDCFVLINSSSYRSSENAFLYRLAR